MSRLALRSHYWGVLVVVVAAGDLNTEGADLLASYLRASSSTTTSSSTSGTSRSATPMGSRRSRPRRPGPDEAGWGFAVVADPDGACAEALEASGVSDIATYADRRAAREALQH